MFYVLVGLPRDRVHVMFCPQKTDVSSSYGAMVLSELQCIPKRLGFLFDQEFQDSLPGAPSFEWAIRIHFIAEQLLLQGWHEAVDSERWPHARFYPSAMVDGWLSELRAIFRAGGKTRAEIGEALDALRHLGCRTATERGRSSRKAS